MPKCNSCGKKGLFLNIEEDTGLCLACNEKFAREGKILTEKITEAKRLATVSKNPTDIKNHCGEILKYGDELIQLHQRFNLTPSHELIDLLETYKKMGDLAADKE